VPLATFASIREPDVCSYEAVICTPLACGSGGPRDQPTDPRNVSASALLEPLSGLCFTRHEGWWSYELCYKRQIRQFHLVTNASASAATRPCTAS
jgi:hypothetical protein